MCWKALIEQAHDERGTVDVCLTGGSTPRTLYSLLADEARPWRRRLPWHALEVFWGDERHVPPDDPESNYRMAFEALISKVPIPKTQVHRIRAELDDAHDAARDYERELDGVTFDVQLLGVGDDAHIASIFPGSPLLDRADAGRPSTGRRQDVAAVWAAHLNMWRITLTPERLLDARTTMMLVAGGNKAAAVYAALEGPEDPRRWPVQILRAAGARVEWFIDRPAAADLRAP